MISGKGIAFIEEIKEISKTTLRADYLIAYISATRCEGHCRAIFLFQNDAGELCAHHFKLKFNHIGIKDYLYYENLSKRELFQIIDKEGLYPIHSAYAKRILRDAYLQNCRYKKRLPGDYSKYIDLLFWKESDNHKRVISKLQENIRTTPRIINIYLLALKNLDLALIYDLATESLKQAYGAREDYIKNGEHLLQNHTLLKSDIINFQIEEKYKLVVVQLTTMDSEEKLDNIIMEFKIQETYYSDLIADVQIKKTNTLESEDQRGPFNYPLYAKVYKIKDYSHLRSLFEKNKDFYITGELENKLCYKWFKTVDNLEVGIDILEQVYGEFILTKTELIVYSHKLINLSEICSYIKENLQQDSLSFFFKAKCNMTSIQSFMMGNLSFNELQELKSQETYIISKKDLGKWNIYCLKKSCKSFFYKNMTIFKLHYRGEWIEIIFYKNNGIINLFDNCLQKASKELAFPHSKLYRIQESISELNSLEDWTYLKIIRELRASKLTRVYKGHFPNKELTDQYTSVQ